MPLRAHPMPAAAVVLLIALWGAGLRTADAHPRWFNQGAKGVACAMRLYQLQLATDIPIRKEAFQD